MNAIIIFILSHPAGIITALLAFFETYVRLHPTEKNHSILDLLHSLANIILPNRRNDGTKFKDK